jgi:hypothetical protein
MAVTSDFGFCSCDMNLLGDDIEIIKKNTQTLIDASKEVVLEVNANKTKFCLWLCMGVKLCLPGHGSRGI